MATSPVAAISWHWVSVLGGLLTTVLGIFIDSLVPSTGSQLYSAQHSRLELGYRGVH